MVTIAYKYSRKWKFRFNPPKCMVLTFGNTSEKESIKVGDVVVKAVTKCTNLGTPMYAKSSHEMEEIEVRIERAYKKVWMLKSIGSMRVQINLMTFSKGYWAATVSKICYGLFLTNIKNKTLDRLDKMHVDIARNIQGTQYTTYSRIGRHEMVVTVNPYCKGDFNLHNS